MPDPADMATENPHAALTAGLRDLADFLDAHVELPEIRAVAWISEYRHPRRDAREDLTALAVALGGRAIEERSGAKVRIASKFGPIYLHAEADVTDLMVEPAPAPEYEPIIKPTPERFRDDGGEAEPTYLPIAGGQMIRDLDERPSREEL